MVIHQLFCGVLLPGFVQNSTQHPGEVSTKLFAKHFVQVQVVQPYHSAEMAAVRKNSCFILTECLDSHTVSSLLMSN